MPMRVAPRAGAWIETHAYTKDNFISASPPARGRGLKQMQVPALGVGDLVAPRAGAWIETTHRCRAWTKWPVAPRAGAWIETRVAETLTIPSASRPPRGGVD